MAGSYHGGEVVVDVDVDVDVDVVVDGDGGFKPGT